MSQTYGSNAKVRFDRPDRLNRARTEKDVKRVARLIIEVRLAWDEAVDAGVWAPRRETGGRGTGFADSHPVESAVSSPTRKQLRVAAAEAAGRIAEARAALQEASDILHSAMLRSDPDVLAEFLEKRGAALG